jgi:cytochrome c
MLTTIPLFLILTFSSPNALYKAKCESCHGKTGQGQPGFSPKLAGQYSFYLKNQILDIKSGRRTNGGSSLMKGIFGTLTDEDIEGVSKYLEKLDD